MNQLLDRFLRYVAVDSQSAPDVDTVPSTEGQRQMAQLLQAELVELGFAPVSIDQHGCVMATLASNVAWHVPTIGFISHMDTAPDCSGKDVKPQIIKNYQGGDIALGSSNEVLSPMMFPALHQLHGQTLITTDGTTLLGADDKAGIAEIITAMLRLRQQNIAHGEIRIAFTPDEEVGNGAQYFDVAAFNAEWAYTIDGGAVGELEGENFNAASATIRIRGNNVHPGTAKGVMVNALTLASQIHQALPPEQTPEQTEGYQGFFHLTSMHGSVSEAEMHYIIRDFNREDFAARKQLLKQLAYTIEQRQPQSCRVEVVIEDTYFNMHDEVAKFPHIMALAEQAMTELGIDVLMCPIRGGTDGAQLSFRGLPCPNLFTGGYNYHGKHEFVTLEGMEKAVAVIMKIAQLTAQRAQS
jgi:tripeptide aminopeptidase